MTLIGRDIVPQCYPSCVAISSRQNPIVARYRAAARGDDDKVVLLDGAHLVADALAAGVHLREAAVTATAQNDEELATLLTSLDRARVRPEIVTSAVMSALSPVRSSSPIVAIADRPTTNSAGMHAQPSSLVIVAVDIQDPGNLGAIIRVAEAGGATGVIATGMCADPFGWKALRGSMGSALRLPVGIVDDPLVAVDSARRAGARLIATVPRGGSALFDLRLKGPTAILLGGEGRGLPDPVIAIADERVTIPMQAPVESLNVAVTAALLVYEARRRRGSH